MNDDLRERVIELEARSIRDREEIAALKMRVAALQTARRTALAARLLAALEVLQERNSIVVGLTWNGRHGVDTEIRPPYADSLIALAEEAARDA